VPVRGRVDLAYRLPNPVSFLPGHDNGVVIDLPSPPGGAAQEVAGTLTFGVGNNRLGTSALVRLDAAGRFTTVFGGKARRTRVARTREWAQLPQPRLWFRRHGRRSGVPAPAYG